MLYAKVVKGEVVAWPLYEEDVRRELSNISLPRIIEGTDLTGYGIHEVPINEVPKPRRPLHHVILGDPIWVRGKLTRTYKEVPIDQETIDERLNAIRIRRNALLAASDWTQLPDAPLSDEEKQAWITYRQELRDVTKNLPDPFKVVWPTEPK